MPSTPPQQFALALRPSPRAPATAAPNLPSPRSPHSPRSPTREAEPPATTTQQAEPTILPTATTLEWAHDVLPPEAIYETREELYRAINQWARARGYAFSTMRSNINTREPKAFYCCDRAGHPPPVEEAETRIRKTTSRRIGCGFSVKARQIADGSWALYHRDAQFCQHNHDPSYHPSAHPVHRQLSTEALSQVSTLVRAGAPTREIRTIIGQTNPFFSQQDTYNRIKDIRLAACEGQSPIAAFVEQLHDKQWWSRVQLNDDSQVIAVIFAHPGSLDLLRLYPEILIMDCTYKTNSFKMPLLDLAGVTADGKTFFIAFAWLTGESEGDFDWALGHVKTLYLPDRQPTTILTDRSIACMNAVKTHFPSSPTLLCIWHANKAVQAHCRGPIIQKLGTQEDWKRFNACYHQLIKSPSQHVYSERLHAFEQLVEFSQEFAYLKNTWLIYKEKLVHAWIDHHLHFGNNVTSRIEGMHAVLKAELKVSLFHTYLSLLLSS